MFSTPAGLSNMGSQGVQNLVIHWKKITRSPQGNPRSSKTPPNTSSGLAPLIWSILAPSHTPLALPGCLKWTILPPKKTYWEKSFRELQGTPGMSKTTQNTLSEWATLIFSKDINRTNVVFHSSPSSRNRRSTRLSISVEMMTFSFFLFTLRSISWTHLGLLGTHRGPKNQFSPIKKPY